MSLQRQLLILATSVLSVACLFKAGFLTIQRFLIVPSTHPLLAAAQTTSEPFSNSLESTPQTLLLSRLDIQLPVIPSLLKNNQWQLSAHGVSLLTTPAPADQAGYIMYGHNWSHILGKLHQAEIGDEIILQYANQPQKSFQIVSRFTVAPDQLQILDLAQPETIVLYTCTGFLDSQRLVVIAQKS